MLNFISRRPKTEESLFRQYIICNRRFPRSLVLGFDKTRYDGKNTRPFNTRLLLLSSACAPQPRVCWRKFSARFVTLRVGTIIVYALVYRSIPSGINALCTNVARTTSCPANGKVLSISDEKKKCNRSRFSIRSM